MSAHRRTEAAIRRRVASLPERDRLAARIRRASFAHGVHYDLGPRRRVAIAVMPVPAVLCAPQLAFLHRLCETVNGYVRAMPAIWERDRAVREAMPFSDAERAFVEAAWSASAAGPQTVVTRIDLDMPDDPRDTVVFEANGCSIGGIWYAATCGRVLDDAVLGNPRLARLRAGLHPLHDTRDLVADLLVAHARAVGAPRRPRVGILENREWNAGITEMPSLAAHFAGRGLESVLGDPRDLRIGRGGLRLGGRVVDILYRNMEASDFAEIEAEGTKLEAVREAFRRNLVVSGIAGDFDHKSLWEVLGSKTTRRLVAPEHRALLSRHLLWTRLLREAQTDGPDGRDVDLVPFVLRHRRRLVLKPNRSCGGEGVLLGPTVDDAAWSRAVRRGLRDEERWVVQRFHAGTRRPFPSLRPSGRGPARSYVTFGVLAGPRAHGILGRACRHGIVNVSRGGGLLPVFRSGAGG